MMNEEEKIKDMIDRAKEIIAKNYGFELEINTKWDYAMKITHRSNKQIEMYEETLKFMANCLLDLKNENE